MCEYMGEKVYLTEDGVRSEDCDEVESSSSLVSTSLECPNWLLSAFMPEGRTTTSSLSSLQDDRERFGFFGMVKLCLNCKPSLVCT